MKPGCPNCRSLKARPHCHPADSPKPDGPSEPALRTSKCPWLLCLSCDHIYDQHGRSMPKRKTA